MANPPPSRSPDYQVYVMRLWQEDPYLLKRIQCGALTWKSRSQVKDAGFHAWRNWWPSWKTKLPTKAINEQPVEKFITI